MTDKILLAAVLIGFGTLAVVAVITVGIPLLILNGWS